MFTRLEDIAKLVCDTGKFFCLACRADITAVVHQVPHDGQLHPRECPRCSKVFHIDSILMAATIMKHGKAVPKWRPNVLTGSEPNAT